MFPDEIQKVNPVPPSDPQHLIRGTAVQGVMDILCSRELRTPTTLELGALIKQELRRAFEQFSMQGRSGKNSEQMFQVIRHQIPTALRVLQEYIVTRGWKIKGCFPQKRLSRKSELSFKVVELIATLDLLIELEIEGERKYLVIEGKSTSKPETRSIDQVFFQTALTGASHKSAMLFPVVEAGYLFYSQGTLQMHPINTDGLISTDFQNWWVRRNKVLERIVSGEGDATPGNRNCRFCQFKWTCPDVHVAQKRNPLAGSEEPTIIGLE